MSSYFIIVRQIIFMFVLMSIGFVLCKLRLISDEGTRCLANILIYCSTPAIVITSYINQFSAEKAMKLFICFLLSVFIHLLFIFQTKVFRIKDPLLKNASVIPNSGFMGVPLVSSVLGEEAVFYLSSFIAVNQLVIWTYCIANFNPEYKVSYKRVLKTPIYYSIVIGLFLFITGFSFPSIINQALSGIKSLNTPLSMFVLGSYISRISFKQMISDIKQIYPSVICRLLLFPYFALMFLRFLPDSFSDLKMILMICASSPTAFNVAFFAEKYGGDVAKSTEAICMSTILCLFTIPLFSYLIAL